MGHKPTGDARLHPPVRTVADAYAATHPDAPKAQENDPTASQSQTNSPGKGEHLNTHGRESRLTVPSITLEKGFAAAQGKTDGTTSKGTGGRGA